jgi:hypothetical protein
MIIDPLLFIYLLINAQRGENWSETEPGMWDKEWIGEKKMKQISTQIGLFLF